MHMANAADQACEPNGFPAAWLADASQWGRWAKQCTAAIPPVFDGCDAVVSRDEEERLLETYDTALRSGCDDPTGAARRLSDNAAARFVAEPLIWLGFLSLIRGEPARAAAYGEEADKRLTEWNACWDKRLPLEQWRELNGLLKRSCTRAGRGGIDEKTP